ncbi:DUF4126 family protein [Pararobbsia alpina]|uniref:DUF4126 domain-containing protein n=1 Tax=Pararobbsia alpina TaxID=621374 RepID=A0A6S7BH69_9BURK|nr:DUF4126 family protein [Pararobbsia alpina]CAB3787719.1 hypothetical protein LMG28138_02478 [Pararobbsia alpina]
MLVYVLALLIGIVAGLRTLTAPAVISWAAYLGVLPLLDTPLAFLAHPVTPYILTVLAIAELIADQLPKTPSRKVPLQFGARLVSGALCGAAIAAPSGMIPAGLIIGVIGAVIGTLGGAKARAILAAALRRDVKAALIEDVVAVAGAVAIAASL